MSKTYSCQAQRISRLLLRWTPNGARYMIGTYSGTTMGAVTEAPASGPVLLAGVGFTNLRDASVGPVLCDRLRVRAWPPGVVVEDYGIGAIDAIERLRDGRYRRAVFFGSESRGDAPGTVRRYLAGAETVDPAILHECMQEAGDGLVSLRSTILLAGLAGALPVETVVFEVEPDDMNYGFGFTAKVDLAVERLEDLLKEEVGMGVGWTARDAATWHGELPGRPFDRAEN